MAAKGTVPPIAGPHSRRGAKTFHTKQIVNLAIRCVDWQLDCAELLGRSVFSSTTMVMEFLNPRLMGRSGCSIGQFHTVDKILSRVGMDNFRSYTQYIPLSIYDLQSWMGSPSIYV